MGWLFCRLESSKMGWLRFTCQLCGPSALRNQRASPGLGSHQPLWIFYVSIRRD